MASEVEETLKRLVTHKGVIGTIVVNADGIPIKSTLDNHTTTQVINGTVAGSGLSYFIAKVVKRYYDSFFKFDSYFSTLA